MPALITDLLDRSARLYPDRVAVRILGGPSLTYSELSQRVGRVAAVLARMGVGRGDRVAVRDGLRRARVLRRLSGRCPAGRLRGSLVHPAGSG